MCIILCLEQFDNRRMPSKQTSKLGASTHVSVTACYFCALPTLGRREPVCRLQLSPLA